MLLIKTFKDLNRIEGLLSDIKYLSKHIHNTIPGSTNLGCLNEALRRRNLKYCEEKKLNESIKLWFIRMNEL